MFTFQVLSGNVCVGGVQSLKDLQGYSNIGSPATGRELFLSCFVPSTLLGEESLVPSAAQHNPGE